MKIRTDFVTNSSSSSFTVQIDVKLTDGSIISFENTSDAGESPGDYESVYVKLSPKKLGEAESVAEMIRLLNEGVTGYVWSEDNDETEESVVFSDDSVSSEAKAFTKKLNEIESMDRIESIHIVGTETMVSINHTDVIYNLKEKTYTGQKYGHEFDEYPNGGCGGDFSIPDPDVCHLTELLSYQGEVVCDVCGSSVEPKEAFFAKHSEFGLYRFCSKRCCDELLSWYGDDGWAMGSVDSIN